MIQVSVSPARIKAVAPADLNLILTNTGTDTCTKVIFTIRLPTGLVRLGGRSRIEVKVLPPGCSATSPIRVRAEEAGRYELASTNFSYRDHLGRSHRETDFAAEITVDPAESLPPPPQVRAELVDTDLRQDEWTVVRGRVTNTGAVDVSSLTLTLSGQVAIDDRTARRSLNELPPGRSADLTFYIKAGQVGTGVPVHLDLTYSHRSRRHMAAVTQSIRVTGDHVARSRTPPEPVRDPVKILILGANPPDTEPLRIDQEIREIQATIRAGRYRDNLEASVRLAVRHQDISQALLDEEPKLVHFAGHGGGQEGSIAAENDYGLAQIISVDGLVCLFRDFGQSVDCIIANACDTESLARELSAVVPYAIGMRQPVQDKSSIEFSTGFYQALAAGKPIEDAFQLGVIMIMMSSIGSDALAPVLFRRG